MISTDGGITALVRAPKALPEYTSLKRRIELLTCPYEPTAFDIEPRPRWKPPSAANDNHTQKNSFPALDEARNNTLMNGCSASDTLIQNDWAFDILLKVRALLDAVAPTPAW
jgi:hypothetical protein